MAHSYGNWTRPSTLAPWTTHLLDMLEPLKSQGNAPYAPGKPPGLQGAVDECKMFLQVLFIANICDPVNNSLLLAPLDTCLESLPEPSFSLASEWRAQRGSDSEWIVLKTGLDAKGREESLYFGIRGPGRNGGIGIGSG